MKKSFISLMTVAAVCGTFSGGAHISAKEVTVEKGDTLWGIAQENNILVDDLKEWNNLSSHLIYPDDQLKVALTEEYLIEKGDTLSYIVEKYEGVTLKELQEWNQLEDPDLIKSGDTLTIYVKGAPYNKKIVTTSLETNENQSIEESNVKVNEQGETKSTTNEKPIVQEQEASAAVDEPIKSQEDTKEDTDVAMELTMTATAYTASCDGCSGITATGINLIDNPDKKVISVDPDVIPLGSKVYVEGYGNAIAGDTGGAIQGNKIDIFIPNKQDAINWGVQEVKVKVFN
ncbi:LysM peptidoglycan-binding and 3D domain-containing protein [Alkalihalobacterium alkalinitrilicum]|uniref:LysM peptidoglycan-binding and 3D domain-containing protein n=1 Tax=Alkalihalobacterium alkalinitrilicum TaxID=427920 RepID=UPI000994FC1A|nr:3D domain-containing protein [Alkalihalobacterium alkalinitrilicum]